MVKVTNELLARIGDPCFASPGTFFNQGRRYPHQCNLAGTNICDRKSCVPALVVDHFTERPGQRFDKDNVGTLAREIVTAVPRDSRVIVSGSREKARVKDNEAVVRRIGATLGGMLTFLKTEGKGTAER